MLAQSHRSATIGETRGTINRQIGEPVKQRTEDCPKCGAKPLTYRTDIDCSPKADFCLKEATDRYVERMANLTPEQTRHSGCSHADGICSGGS